MQETLRVEKGKKLEAGIVGLGFASCTIRSIEESRMIVELALVRPLQESAHKTVLVLAHPRPPVMKRLLRDLSSLAIDAVITYVPDRGEKSYLDARFWNNTDALCLQGAMQGRVCKIPLLAKCIGLREALSLLTELLSREHLYEPVLPVIQEQEGKQFFLDIAHDFFEKEMEEHAATQHAFLQKLGLADLTKKKGSTFVCFIGPERQHSQEEETLIRSLSLVSSQLGEQTLRTEVAALLSLSLWNMAVSRSSRGGMHA